MDCEQRCIEGVIYSLSHHNIELICLSKQHQSPAYYSKYVSKYINSPDLSKSFETYFQFLMALPYKGVILPSGDLSVVFLADYQKQLLDAGFLFNILEKDILTSIFDKWTCHELCCKTKVPCANTWLVTDESSLVTALDKLDYPIIIKPTRLAGGNYIKVFNDKQAIDAYRQLNNIVNSENFRSHHSGVIAQKWIESGMQDNWSCEIFYDSHGTFKGAVTFRRIRTSLNDLGTPTSRFYAGQRECNDTLVAYARKLLEYVGWKGMAHVEFVYDHDSGQFILNEVNPRLPGYAYFLSNIGFEMAFFYYADLCNIDYEAEIQDGSEYYFEALRYPGDITDGIVNIFRGYISAKEFLGSYAKALRSDEKVVIEYFNYNDFRLTMAIQLTNILHFLKKIRSFIRRRI
jgi:predicted ATP-grasp superfamily ATP-dependent carboligase